MIELTDTHTWVTAHVSSDPMKVKRLTNGPGSLRGAESAMCLFFLLEKTKVEESRVQLWKALMGFFRALQDNDLFSSPTI